MSQTSANSESNDVIKRVQWSFLTTLILMLCFGGLSIYGFEHLKNESEVLKGNLLRQWDLVNEMKLSIVEVQQWLTDVSATRAKPGFDDGPKQAAMWSEKFEKASAEFKVLAANDKISFDRQTQIEQAFQAYYAMGKKMAQSYVEGGPDSGNTLMKDFDPLADKLDNLLSEHRQFVRGPLEKQLLTIHEDLGNGWLINILGLIITTIASVYLLISTIRMLRNRLTSISFVLKNSYDRVSGESRRIRTSSSTLAEVAGVQASTIEETATSLHEISSMVDSNASSADKNHGATERSRETLEKSREEMIELERTVLDVRNSEKSLQDAISTSSHQLEEINSIIGQIAEKTKMLNGIVFQTKLLSFNASVEAARAGEKGKGFSIVAEEVGKLANLSGNSASDINEIVTKGQAQIQTALDVLRQGLEGAMGKVRTSIDTATTTTHSLRSKFDDALNETIAASTTAQEIAIATQEQAQGIKQISIAVAQMNDVAHKLNHQSEEARDSANGLDQALGEFNHGMIDLKKTIGDQVT
jgi:methyl-accepting chemotaxis protein